MGTSANDTLILEQLRAILSKVLQLDIANLQLTHVANDFEGWDSFTHMEIISAVEKHYQFQFSFQEVMKLNSIGDLVELIKSKQL